MRSWPVRLATCRIGIDPSKNVQRLETERSDGRLNSSPTASEESLTGSHNHSPYKLGGSPDLQGLTLQT